MAKVPIPNVDTHVALVEIFNRMINSNNGNPVNDYSPMLLETINDTLAQEFALKEHEKEKVQDWLKASFVHGIAFGTQLYLIGAMQLQSVGIRKGNRDGDDKETDA